jgi:hypothetical protein
MAKQRETRKPAPATPARRTATPAAPVALKWKDVEFVVPENAGPIVETELPPGWDSAEEAPSGLTPAADWQEPGEGFVGEFIGMQEGIGPNKSRLYAFKAADGSAVSIWGSTALDARMNFIQPAKGDTILVQYTGTQPTSRNLSPVKTFRVLRQK